MIRLAVATILVANLLAVVLAWLARCPDLSAHEHHGRVWRCGICDLMREWDEIERRQGE